jgi:maleate isomerase
VEAVAAIEARTGRPVVTSNQSTIWTALRAIGVSRPIAGFGRLLESLGSAAPATR